MSMPSFPPNGADLTREEALTMIIASIAMEEPFSSIWFWATTSSREATLLFTASTSWGQAQGFAPGRHGHK